MHQHLLLTVPAFNARGLSRAEVPHSIGVLRVCFSLFSILTYILFITYGQAIEEGSDESNVFHLLPKFHPKLNPLEYLWGWLKCYFWECSNGKFDFAKCLVPTSLNACPLVTI
jgi:hypothetical protein